MQAGNIWHPMHSSLTAGEGSLLHLCILSILWMLPLCILRTPPHEAGEWVACTSPTHPTNPPPINPKHPMNPMHPSPMAGEWVVCTSPSAVTSEADSALELRFDETEADAHPGLVYVYGYGYGYGYCYGYGYGYGYDYGYRALSRRGRPG